MLELPLVLAMCPHITSRNVHIHHMVVHGTPSIACSADGGSSSFILAMENPL